MDTSLFLRFYFAEFSLYCLRCWATSREENLVCVCAPNVHKAQVSPPSPQLFAL